MSRDSVWITRPLLAVLLSLADDADPRSVNVLLVATPARDLEPMPDGEKSGPGAEHSLDLSDTGEHSPSNSLRSVDLADLDPDRPVYSDFYFPDVGNAVRNVFGVDLGTPPRQSHGRFLSHPAGDPEMSIRDDLHAVVLVGTPPWAPENVVAYDRRSNRQDLAVVAAGTPDAAFEG